MVRCVRFPTVLRVLPAIAILSSASFFPLALRAGSASFEPAAERNRGGPPDRRSEATREYDLTPTRIAVADGETPGLEARNPVHNLLAEFRDGGVGLTPLTAGEAWQIELRLTGYGAGGDVRPVNEAAVRYFGNRVELARGALTEWYVNDPRGLEQGFTLHDPPPGSGGRIVLEVEFRGDLVATPDPGGRGIDLTVPGERISRLHYDGLRVVDAAGIELDARFDPPARTTDGVALSIAIEASRAAWPIEVDPLLTSAAWSSPELDQSTAVAWGDWDEDGDLDLAVANEAGPNRLYENHGGTLRLRWSSPDSVHTTAIAWGDWDGDGDLDLAAGNFGGPNRIYENHHGAKLEHGWSSDESDRTTSLALGDWDGDGDLDLAVGNQDEPNRIDRNDDRQLIPQWSDSVAENTTSIAFADMTFDGPIDLVVGNRGAPNRVYRNDRNRPVEWWSSSDTDDTTAIAIGDWKGNGVRDLIAGNDGQPNRVYENNTYGLIPRWTSAESDRTTGVAVVDWDGDGDLDLVAVNDGEPNRLYEHDGSGAELVWSSTETDATTGVAVADWDADGDLDLAEANLDAPVRVVTGVPGPIPASWRAFRPELTKSVAWGDWDGDGDLDLATGSDDLGTGLFTPGVAVWRSGNVGVQILNRFWIAPEADRTWAVAWGDWDGDGDLDLASGNFFERNRVYRNDDGTLTEAWSSPQREFTQDIAWADWDQDGDLDLVAGNYGAPVRVYDNQDGTLVLAWSSIEEDRTTSARWGDWDDDGDLDLAVGNTSEQPNRVYENTGGDLRLAWSSTHAENTSEIAWGDWDGDGDLDLVAGNFEAPVRVYENTGGNLAPAWESTRVEDTTAVSWGDWDGDGDLDLVVGNLWNNIRFYFNIDGSLTYVQDAGKFDALLEQMVFADWDGDGDLDLAAGNRCPVIEDRVYGNNRVNAAGLLPDSPVHPVAHTRPGTTQTGFEFSSAERLIDLPIQIPYRLVDHEGDTARRIVVEYSLNGGGLWQPATQAHGGDGIHDLGAGPDGVDHVFAWDAAADEACSDQVRIRISVVSQAPLRVAGPITHGRLSTVTPPFRVGAPRRPWYLDADGDGFGDPGSVRNTCWEPEGHVDNPTDCADGAASIHPGAIDLPGNHDDENCDGSLEPCDPEATWANHGAFVSCVAHEVGLLVDEGHLSGREGARLIRAAARSRVGR